MTPWRAASGLLAALILLACLGLVAAVPAPAHALAVQQIGVTVDATPAAAPPAAQPEPLPPPTTADVPFWRWVWRTLALLGAAGLLGAPLFSSLVLGGLPRAEIESLVAPLARRLAALVAGLGALVVLALAIDMVYEIALLDGTDAFAALGNLGLAPQIITTTGYGAFWVLKVIAALALCGYGLWRRSAVAQAEWPAAVLNGGFLFAGEALGSHEAATRGIAGLPVGFVSDLVHLVAAGAWIGGLLYLAVVLLPVLRHGDPAAGERLLGRAVPRFSNLALISVGVLVVTGVLNLATHTLDPGAVLDTDYGRVLVLKHLLFLPLLALGAVNNQVLRPQLMAVLLPGAPAPTGRVAGHFRRVVGAEVVLGVAVLACAAALTLLPPPIGVTITSARPGGDSGTSRPVAPVVATGSDTVGGVRFDVTANSDPSGDLFSLHLTRVDTTTTPLTDVIKLQVKVIPQDFDAGSTSLDVAGPRALDPDSQVYTATGQVLTLAGNYQLTAEFLRAQSADLRAGFRLTLADDGALTMTQSPVLRAIVATQPSPPISGTVQLTIRIVDGLEQPVPDAQVKLTPLMPTHGHVEPDSLAQPLASQPGVYQATTHFTMVGPWLLMVEVTRPGQPPILTDADLDVIDPHATPPPAPP